MTDQIKCAQCGNDGTRAGLFLTIDARRVPGGWRLDERDDDGGRELDCLECDHRTPISGVDSLPYGFVVPDNGGQALALSPDDWRAVLDAVSNSDMPSEARIGLLDKISAVVPGASAIIGAPALAANFRAGMKPDELAAFDAVAMLGFEPEIGGGGALHLSRYLDSERSVWITGSQGTGLPTLADWCCATHPGNSESRAGIPLIDVRSTDGNSATLLEAALACVAVAEQFPPEIIASDREA